MVRKNLHTLISVLILIVISGFMSASSFKKYCDFAIPVKSEFGKSPVRNKDKISGGFTLFTSLNLSGPLFKGGTIYLTDLYGSVVYRWTPQNKTLYSILKPDGNLVATQTKINDQDFPWAARITSIQELDPSSKVVWEYKNPALHHDFDVLENGNIAVLEWIKVPQNMVSSIKGGREGSEFNGQDIFTDRILEIDRDRNIVWSWNASDHLNPEEFEIPWAFTREQWTHANSIKHIKSNPINNKEAYLVSMRYLNTVFLIDKQTGEIIWRSPKGLFVLQHDATLLNNGNILAFNNGFHTEPSQNPFSYGSSVIEINPKTNQVVWEFPGSKNPLDASKLTEVILSGAQRLPNGNTLITLGTSGRIIEVTPDKKVVWDMINPYSDPTDQPFRSNYIFKSRKYFKEDINWLNQFNFGSQFAEFCF